VGSTPADEGEITAEGTFRGSYPRVMRVETGDTEDRPTAPPDDVAGRTRADRQKASHTVTSTLLRRTAPDAARAAGRGVSALIGVALTPLTLDLSRMSLDAEHETWM